MHDLRLRTYAAGTTMAPHFHEEDSFTIVLDGSYRENIRGRALEHTPGAMLFYPAGETHSQSFGPTGSRKLIFRPNTACLGFLKDEKVPLAQAPFLATATVRDLARRVERELQTADSFSSLVVDGTILELVATFGRRYVTNRQSEAVPAWLKQTRERLEEQPGTGETHESLAAHVNKHPVHLAKAFKKSYGETIGECQRRLRLNKAESLLRKRDMSLADVAMECGFANQAHLSRSFKCASGSTPARYRAGHYVR